MNGLCAATNKPRLAVEAWAVSDPEGAATFPPREACDHSLEQHHKFGRARGPHRAVRSSELSLGAQLISSSLSLEGSSLEVRLAPSPRPERLIEALPMSALVRQPGNMRSRPPGVGLRPASAGPARRLADSPRSATACVRPETTSANMPAQGPRPASAGVCPRTATDRRPASARPASARPASDWARPPNLDLRPAAAGPAALPRSAVASPRPFSEYDQNHVAKLFPLSSSPGYTLVGRLMPRRSDSLVLPPPAFHCIPHPTPSPPPHTPCPTRVLSPAFTACPTHALARTPLPS